MNRSILKKLAVNSLSLMMGVLIIGAPFIANAAFVKLPGITCGVSGMDRSTNPPTPIKDGNCLIPCNGDIVTNTATGETDCNFNTLLLLFKNVMYYLIYISIPVAALAFAYAGFLYLTAATGSSISHARSIFTKVAIGLVVILAAWLAVKTIVDALLVPSFSPLK